MNSDNPTCPRCNTAHTTGTIAMALHRGDDPDELECWECLTTDSASEQPTTEP